MILEINGTSIILLFLSGTISGLIAHLRGDNRLRWFLIGFVGIFAPLISILFSGRKNNEGKGKDSK